MSSRTSGDASPRLQIYNTPGAFPSSPGGEQEHGAASAAQSLSQAVRERRSEYVRMKTIKVKIGTWNVAALNGTDKDVGAWFVQGKGVHGLNENLSGLSIKERAHTVGSEVENIESCEDQELRQTKKEATVPKNDVPAVAAGEEIQLYVLGLQEIVDINSPSEALRPFTDPYPSKKWKTALEEALPRGYKLIAEQQMSGLFLVIYASPEVAASISSVSSTSVGTGLMGYMRNKGAVCARIVLGETTRLVFVNCHLAAGSDKAALERRNWDAAQILSRARFDPMPDSSEVVAEYGDAIGDEDVAFWFGDLNYRLDDIPGDDVRRLLLLHTRNEYDINNKSRREIHRELGYVSGDQNPSPKETAQASQHPKSAMECSDDDTDDVPLDPESDPASLHTTLQSLLPHDQLRDQQKKRKAFHEGWNEGEIDFLPTYKYDVGSVGMFDSGDKKRGPSWCDRILYRTRQNRIEAARQMKEEEEGQKRDDEMRQRGLDKSDDDDVFGSDPGSAGFAGTAGYGPGEEYDEEEDAAVTSELEPGRTGTDDAILLEHYGSHQRVLSSDHKPLDAVFRINYEAVIPELKAKVHLEVARELDKQENEERPGVTVVVDHQPEGSNDEADASAEKLELNAINFGEVRYGVRKSAGLTVANTGGVLATFLFVDRPIGDGQKNGIAPSWVHLDVAADNDNATSNRNALQEYTLSPGETVYVHLSVEVRDLKLVRQLNEGKVRLDDILVLRVKEGRDYFVSVSGSWMQSSFCRTLDELVLLPEGGVRKMQQDITASRVNVQGLESPDRPIRHQKLSASRELFALTETVQDLAQRAVAEWQMVHEEGSSRPPWKQGPDGNGWPFGPQGWTMTSQERFELLASAREALDTGASLISHFPEHVSTLHRLEVLAETLVDFLRSLQDGIITTELWTQLESHIITTSKSGLFEADPQSRILEVLSTAPVHNVAFTFITFMLARIANEIAPVCSKPTTSARSQSSRRSTSSAGSPVNDPQQQQQLAPSLSVLPFSLTTANSPQKLVLSSFRRSRARSNASASAEEPAISEDASTRQAVEYAYADIFAEAMIRRPQGAKERKTGREMMRRVILPFLRTGS